MAEVANAKYQEFLAKIDEIREDAVKAYEKGNKAAARRARVALVELRDIIKEVRAELLETAKAEKAE